jgi:hypothetical protein
MIQLLGGIRATIFFVLLLITSTLFGVKSCQYENYKREVDQAKAKAERIAREKEEGWRQGIAQWVESYVRERNKHEKALDDAITSLRNGNLQLRKRFTCPKATAPAPGADGGEASGLSKEDAEFLLREAARADELALEHALLQKYVKEIHK